MKRLFDYCYYRIAKAYRKVEDKYYCMYGSFVSFLPIIAIVLVLISLVLYQLNKKLTSPIIIGVVVILSVVSLFFDSQNKYDELEQEYKNEKHSKLKGCLVFLWILSPIALYIIMINVLDV